MPGEIVYKSKTHSTSRLNSGTALLCQGWTLLGACSPGGRDVEFSFEAPTDAIDAQGDIERADTLQFSVLAADWTRYNRMLRGMINSLGKDD